MINKDALVIWREESNSLEDGGDLRVVMLIDQLLETYKQLDSERASKNAVIRASADIIKESKRKDDQIRLFIESSSSQDASLRSAIAAFRKIYELSVYGNSIFRNEQLLRLWIAVEKFTGSTSNEEMSVNSINMLSIAHTLNDDTYLVDLRNNLVSFTDYVQAEDGEREYEREYERSNKAGESDTAGSDGRSVKKSNDANKPS